MHKGRLLFLPPRSVRQFLHGRCTVFPFLLPFSPLWRRCFNNSSSPNNLPPGKDLHVPPQEPRQFYRRPLPASCIAFGTAEGRQLFKEALEMGFLEPFFDLVPQLRTQVQPSYCGLSAMVMVLNSFEMDPGRIWKAPWRWYHEDMLTCCLSTEELQTHGITLDQFQTIAKCNGLNVDLRQPTLPGETVATFRSRLLSICSQSLSTSGAILVISYDRKAVKQTGSGHFAVVAGYHPKRDLLLVLETAAFKYPSHWAPLTAIYNGMCSLDAVTGRPRGYMLITKAFHARMGLSSPHSSDPVSADAGTRNPATQNQLSDESRSPPQPRMALHVNQLLNRLILFSLADSGLPSAHIASQAFSSPTSLLDPRSAGGRLRAVADEWSAYLSSTSLVSLGETCCCLLQRHSWNQDHGEQQLAKASGNLLPLHAPCSVSHVGPSHRCECPCLVDVMLDALLSLLLKHRPPDFFFTCQPLWSDCGKNASSTFESATQVIFELVSSATGRRARLALDRLQHRSYEWLTSESGGPLTYRTLSAVWPGSAGALGTTRGNGVSPRRPACALPLVTDPKIRATALLTAFIIAFPYHTVRRTYTNADVAADDGTSQATFVEALGSSDRLLRQLPLLPGQTCFAVLTPGTRNELNTLSNIFSQLMAIRRPLGSRCIGDG